MNRKPNAGPYVVSFTKPGKDERHERECHTWADACAFMRSLLILDAENVSVKFA